MVKLNVPKTLSLAKSYENGGELDEARQQYESVLSAYPKNVQAQKALARLTDQRPVDQNFSAQPERLDELIALYHQGKFSQVIGIGSKFAEEFPSSAVIWNLLGASNAGMNLSDEATRCFREVCEIRPNDCEAHNNLGVALTNQLNLIEAEASFNRAIQIDPNHIEANNNLGNIQKEEGKLDDAVESFTRALKVQSNHPEILYNLGSAYLKQGNLDKALGSFTRALQIKPDYALVQNGLGLILRRQGKMNEAIASFTRALQIKPDYAEALNNRGKCLFEQHELSRAVFDISRAVKIKPDFIEAHENLGRVLNEQDKPDKAVESFDHALKITPDDISIFMKKMFTQTKMCDWSALRKFEKIKTKIGVEGKPVSPFNLLVAEDHPERQMRRAQKFALQPKKSAIPLPAMPKVRPEKLRIGYFSGDFREFPGMYLMAGMLETHNRDQFKIYAFSHGPDADDQMRRRIVNAVDDFIDIRTMSDPDVAKLVIEMEIDIAINRNGYTRDGRNELFAKRLAPVQISYLGYPGTMGTEFMDYMVADQIMIPENQRQFYTEKIIYLPNTYQPNDNQRTIAQTTTQRSDFGLPDDAFVFCCFNKCDKIRPGEFHIWMRLLHRLKGSVLWLYRSNKFVEDNLHEEARAKGVDASRIIFADSLPHSEHLARHKHADLFLDTFNYNAHTTASDALWAGLPIVSMAGQQFAARVSASLLRAVGLPELITETEDEYEALIFELATNQEKLAGIKDKLMKKRLTSPLFDTEQYTRDFEQGLKLAYDRCFNSLEPSDIIVPGEH